VTGATDFGSARIACEVRLLWSAERLIEEGVDDGALRHGSPVALSCHLRQDALDLPEVCDLPPDLVEVADRDALDVRARVAAPIDELQERPDLVQREAELAGPADEAQPQALGFSVEPMAAVAPRSGRHQANPLVISDRLDVAAGSLRQGADAPPGRSGRYAHGPLQEKA
jgi:hypothetical protein